MSLHARFRRFQLPVIQSDFELAEWFQMPLKRLQWFADSRSIERTTRNLKLRHYNYRLIGKRFGRFRLIESPKPQLKELQRLVLSEFVEKIPPHVAAHGFRKRRSIKTNAELHAGKRVVLRMDLQDFFPLITVARVRAIFAAAGYCPEVAELLARLCVNSAPSSLWNTLDLDRHDYLQALRYSAPHLPQGAPTSPAIANLVAYRLDCRLTGLAGVVGARYTRYADDLAFSGDEPLVRSVKRFATSVAATVMDEGFHVNHRKTRVMYQSQRQQIAGVVVNRVPNYCRREYDRLKAILHNCVRYGAAGQNRTGHPDWRAHLSGRVAHLTMLNPRRGERLKRLLDKIRWPSDE